MRNTIKTENYSADFGKRAEDYAHHRAEFPSCMYDRLRDFGIGRKDQDILDIGTGTGALARTFAKAGATVTAIDISQNMLDQAQLLADRGDISVNFRNVPAEETGLADSSMDVITAGQCWHWFDSGRAYAEVKRVLRPGGKLVFCHFDWLPQPGSIPYLSEQLILAHNPNWPYPNLSGFHFGNAESASKAGFPAIDCFSYEFNQPYNHEGWRGRIRASAGIGGTLTQDKVAVFDAEHAALLQRNFPQQIFKIPHRVFCIIAGLPPATA